MNKLMSFHANVYESLQSSSDDDRYEALFMHPGATARVKIRKARNGLYINYTLTGAEVVTK